MNLGPSGYEPDELPGCSTPRDEGSAIGCSAAGKDGSGGAVLRSGIWGTGIGIGFFPIPIPIPDRCLLSLEDLAATDSPASWDAVPWALGVFTAEFEMGSGAFPPAMTTRSSKDG